MEEESKEPNNSQPASSNTNNQESCKSLSFDAWNNDASVHDTANSSRTTTNSSRKVGIDETSSDSCVQYAERTIIPDLFRLKIRSLGGDPDCASLVLKKQVTYEDLASCIVPCFCMSVTLDKVRLMLTATETLRLEEMMQIPVTLIQPCLKVTNVILSKSAFKITRGAAEYVLYDPTTRRIAADNMKNRLQLKDNVEFWAFRLPGHKLGLAMVKRSLILR